MNGKLYWTRSLEDDDEGGTTTATATAWPRPSPGRIDEDAVDPGFVAEARPLLETIQRLRDRDLLD